MTFIVTVVKESGGSGVRPPARALDGGPYHDRTNHAVAVRHNNANVRFYPSAATQSGGSRACKRCRTDATPGSPEWNVRADVMGRTMRLVADGVVDQEGVGGLSRRLGYTERHLNLLVSVEVGTCGPPSETSRRPVNE